MMNITKTTPSALWLSLVCIVTKWLDINNSSRLDQIEFRQQEQTVLMGTVNSVDPTAHCRYLDTI